MKILVIVIFDHIDALIRLSTFFVTQESNTRVLFKAVCRSWTSELQISHKPFSSKPIP
jgi:hypothetical protein